MIYTQWLEKPMSRTNFHGPEDVPANEIRLYMFLFTPQKAGTYACALKRSVGNCLEGGKVCVGLKGGGGSGPWGGGGGAGG